MASAARFWTSTRVTKRNASRTLSSGDRLLSFPYRSNVYRDYDSRWRRQQHGTASPTREQSRNKTKKQIPIPSHPRLHGSDERSRQHGLFDARPFLSPRSGGKKADRRLGRSRSRSHIRHVRSRRLRRRAASRRSRRDNRTEILALRRRLSPRRRDASIRLRLVDRRLDVVSRRLLSRARRPRMRRRRRRYGVVDDRSDRVPG